MSPRRESVNIKYAYFVIILWNFVLQSSKIDARCEMKWILNNSKLIINTLCLNCCQREVPRDVEATGDMKASMEKWWKIDNLATGEEKALKSILE